MRGNVSERVCGSERAYRKVVMCDCAWLLISDVEISIFLSPPRAKNPLQHMCVRACVDKRVYLRAGVLVAGGMIQPALQGRIEFRNVSFAYPSRSSIPVLKDFSLAVQPGEVRTCVSVRACARWTQFIFLVIRGRPLVNSLTRRRHHRSQS